MSHIFGTKMRPRMSHIFVTKMRRELYDTIGIESTLFNISMKYFIHLGLDVLGKL